MVLSVNYPNKPPANRAADKEENRSYPGARGDQQRGAGQGNEGPGVQGVARDAPEGCSEKTDDSRGGSLTKRPYPPICRDLLDPGGS